MYILFLRFNEPDCKWEGADAKADEGAEQMRFPFPVPRLNLANGLGTGFGAVSL